MDLVLILQAILLGIVEGLTEFIPVSSTGHLILIIDLIGFQGPPGKVFEIVIQLGAILAVCWVYKERLYRVVIGLPNDKIAQRFACNIVLAFLPAAVIGVMAHDIIKQVLFSPWVVSVSLVIGGVIILVIERMHIQPRYEDVDDLTWKTAVKIGFCQALAMIPGVSRSGATIMGALLLKVERKAATEFSFFLAIPTMLGATVYDVYANASQLSLDNIGLIVIGFVSAFIAALCVVKTVVAFISTHGFTPFAYYRIALGTLMIFLLSQS